MWAERGDNRANNGNHPIDSMPFHLAYMNPCGINRQCPARSGPWGGEIEFPGADVRQIQRSRRKLS